MLSFAKELLPPANAKGVVTTGMKVLGLGSLTHEVESSSRYAFSLPMSGLHTSSTSSRRCGQTSCAEEPTMRQSDQADHAAEMPESLAPLRLGST